MNDPRQFRTYAEFFRFYLTQHSDRRNRWMHVAGTALGFAVLLAAFALGHPWLALLWIPIAYGFAWTGHFLLEGNKPATFGLLLVLHQRLPHDLVDGDRQATLIPNCAHSSFKII